MMASPNIDSGLIDAPAVQRFPHGLLAASQVLVVDDDAAMRSALEISFLRHGWRVDSAAGAQEAVAKFRRRQYALIVTDIRMPDGDGFGVMREVRALAPHTAVILLTAFGSVPDAVAAMRDGACDYLIKPVAFEQLQRAAQKILSRVHALEGQENPGLADDVRRNRTGNRPINNLSNRLSNSPRNDQLIGHSPAWLRALDRARQVAGSDADILIEAESGTGKELLARRIHRLSSRRDQPFVSFNCAACPETLFESELFGHAKGAFTGASAAKPGKFELADGGTLLLDEVGEMPLLLQPKLLRALQEREFDRLGETHSVKVDIRVIATTNRRLGTMVQAGQFRTDLYYRLNVIPLSLPPLRQRPEDVAELAAYFARLYAPAGGVPGMTAEFLARLEQHSWPGNVRELANLMRRAVALCPEEIGLEALEPSELLPPELLPPELLASRLRPEIPGALAAPGSLAGGDRLRPGVSLEAMEKRLLELTLASTGGNRSRTAAMLGVSLRTVRNKIREYGLPSRASYSKEPEQDQSQDKDKDKARAQAQAQEPPCP
jgi:DNA-binding NtrC family response regulator